MKSFVKRAKKAVVGAVGLGAILLSSGQLDGQVEAVVSSVVALATAFGIYQAKNESAPAANGGFDRV